MFSQVESEEWNQWRSVSQQISEGLRDVVGNTPVGQVAQDIVYPRKIGLAPELFGLLATMKVSDAGNISVLEYVKINCIAFQENGSPLEIVSIKWASKRGARGAHRMVAYTQEEKYIRFPLVPLLNTPLEYRGLHQLTTYYGKLGQVEVPYANRAGYGFTAGFCFS